MFNIVPYCFPVSHRTHQLFVSPFVLPVVSIVTSLYYIASKCSFCFLSCDNSVWCYHCATEFCFLVLKFFVQSFSCVLIRIYLCSILLCSFVVHISAGCSVGVFDCACISMWFTFLCVLLRKLTFHMRCNSIIFLHCFYMSFLYVHGLLFLTGVPFWGFCLYVKIWFILTFFLTYYFYFCLPLLPHHCVATFPFCAWFRISHCLC